MCSACRVEHNSDLVIVTDESILVIDHSCDQSIININSFLIQTFTGVSFKINGALSEMKTTTLELSSDVFTLVTTNKSERYVFKLNQVFRGRKLMQNEALLEPHHMRTFVVMVDECSRSHLGPSNTSEGQCVIVN